MKADDRRVLMITRNPPDERVRQEAAELVKNGYAVSVICPKSSADEAPYEVLDGAHIYRHSHSLFWQFHFTLVWKVFFTRGFDVIHACNAPDAVFLIGGYFKLCFRKKFLFEQSAISPRMRLCERLSFKLADVSIAANDSYRKIIIEHGKILPEKVFVVHPCPNLERMQIMPPAPELKMDRKLLVACAGVMGTHEGIQYLIEAARIIVQDYQRQDVQFALIGGGPALEDLKKLATSRGVAEYMTFMGSVPEQTLLEALNTADICVSPAEVTSLRDRSSPDTVMEYMALGKPIVQFDVTEGRFCAQGASLYAKANDAKDFAEQIVHLLNDPGLREKMGKLGRARVQNELSWPHEAPKLLAAYDAVFQR